MISVAVLIYGYIGALGIAGGVHRYWTHKSYKAKLPLRIILAVLYLMSGMVKSSKHLILTKWSFGLWRRVIWYIGTNFSERNVLSPSSKIFPP
jgi:fatty-acid desaturase